VIRDYLPDQHRELFAQLPFIVAGSVDPDGQPWATLLTGVPGFVHSPEPRRLRVQHACDPHDPAWRGIHTGAALGVLGIELPTRRRNRVNGTVKRDAAGFELQVDQSFGNCPRYIHPRSLGPAPAEPAAVECAAAADHLNALDAEAIEQIRHADTLFVASYLDAAGEPPHRQVDVSHRGGPAGFVQVAADGTLTVPDYAGNGFFNTLGNLLENPRAGLTFVDFDTGDVLQLSGTAKLILDGPRIREIDAAQRLWTLRPTHVVRRRGALPLRTDHRALVDRNSSSNCSTACENAGTASRPSTQTAATQPHNTR
jgi:predicted pyridoxine 5'-phosphate oxidase superfamily flavin-nucleotide-binding protein